MQTLMPNQMRSLWLTCKNTHTYSSKLVSEPFAIEKKGRVLIQTQFILQSLNRYLRGNFFLTNLL